MTKKSIANPMHNAMHTDHQNLAFRRTNLHITKSENHENPAPQAQTNSRADLNAQSPVH
jgi:hypothetical protein